MKHLARTYIYNLVALWVTSQLLPGFTVGDSLYAYAISSLVLSLLILLVKPFLKILFIPINILTFGLLSWIINVIVLYLLTIFVDVVQVLPWTFNGLTFVGFVIPEFYLSYTVSLIVSALLLTFIESTLHEIT